MNAMNIEQADHLCRRFVSMAQPLPTVIAALREPNIFHDAL